MTVTEIIGVTVVVICVAVLVGVMIHWMNQDKNVIHYERVIRTYSYHDVNVSTMNYWLAHDWKVKYQSQPLISKEGREYIEYIIYKDEPFKKGDKHDSKQDTL